MRFEPDQKPNSRVQQVYGPRWRLLLTSLILTGGVAACGTQQTQGQANTAHSPGDSSFDQDSDSVGTDDNNGNDGGGADQNAPVVVKKDSALALFCQNLAKLTLHDNLSAYAQRFCSSSGQPQKLMAVTLPAKAYGGTGNLALLKLAEETNDPATKTTSLTIAGAVKLTVTAKHYFEKMTEFMDDSAAAKAAGIVFVPGVVSEDLLDTFNDGGLFYRKGWEKSVEIDNEVSSQIIKSAYEYRADHYELVPGKAYLITNYLTQSITGVRDNVLFAAILQDGDQAYVFGQIYTKTDNRGLPTVARDTMIKIFRDGLKNVFLNGEKIADLPEK